MNRDPAVLVWTSLVLSSLQNFKIYRIKVNLKLENVFISIYTTEHISKILFLENEERNIDINSTSVYPDSP